MAIKNYLCRVFGRIGITKNHWPKFMLEYANMQLYKQKQGYTFDINTPHLFTEKNTVAENTFQSSRAG